jgi:hypothetical protein
MNEFDDIMDIVGGANKKQYVCFVMDHSGSMGEKMEALKLDSKRKSDLAMSNFNEQLQALKAEEDMDVIVTVVEFDNAFKCPIENKLVHSVDPLKTYWTGGMTALYDAIAFGITKVQSMMDKDPSDDKAALVIIQTDGQENYSQEYQGDEGRLRLKERIEELEKTDLWTFTFLGENIDKKIAMDMGLKSGNVMNVAGTVAGYKMSNEATMSGISKYLNARKVGATNVDNFLEEDEGGTWDEKKPRPVGNMYGGPKGTTKWKNKSKKDESK